MIKQFFIKKNLDLDLKKLTPPIKQNWNWGKSRRGYIKNFSSYFIEYIFPYLLKNAREQGLSNQNLSILDIGCGWGAMAIPFLIFNQTSKNSFEGGNRYLGIDIREDAIDWLRNAYFDYECVNFQLHTANEKADYIGAVQAKTTTFTDSDGMEAKFSIPKDFFSNIQWSSSVFTHLTPQACHQALKSIRGCSLSSGIQVNTWLIVDNESKYSLNAKIADRTLSIDCGDFLTYSRNNPLVCTAYKIEAIEKMYLDAGLEILKIDRGSWRGPAYQNGPKHYQDIILSRTRQ